jgi:chromatin segregation and condensation protein Rec8/ScpA/Scc1 (kleisin family)
VASTFLAGLEIGRSGEVALDQAAAFGEIRLRVAPAAIMQAAE